MHLPRPAPRSPPPPLGENDRSPTWLPPGRPSRGPAAPPGPSGARGPAGSLGARPAVRSPPLPSRRRRAQAVSAPGALRAASGWAGWGKPLACPRCRGGDARLPAVPPSGTDPARTRRRSGVAGFVRLCLFESHLSAAARPARSPGKPESPARLRERTWRTLPPGAPRPAPAPGDPAAYGAAERGGPGSGLSFGTRARGRRATGADHR